MLTHPLRNIPANKRRPVFILLFSFTIMVMVLLNVTGRPLTSPSAASGIISYELAGKTDTTQNIIDSWDNQAKISAAFNLGLDYLFLALYSISIGAGILWLTDALTIHHRFLTLADLLAWSLLVAAILDAIENGALYTMLLNGATEPWPRVAFLAAVIKFAIVFLGLLYILIGLLVYLWKRFR